MTVSIFFLFFKNWIFVIFYNIFLFLGGISEDRLTCYDDFWLEKLDNLEKEFAKEKLNIDEADVILNKLSAYTHYKSHDACGAEAMKVKKVYKNKII